jgi:hypothetical protein
MNNNKIHEIKKEDKSAFGKFTILIIIGLIVGMVVGIMSNMMKEGLAELISDGLIEVLSVIAPFANIVLTLVVMILVFYLYQKCRKQYQAWDGDNEEEVNRIEIYLSYALWFTSILMVSSFFFFAVGFFLSTSNIYEYFSWMNLICYIAGFILAMTVTVVAQQKIVNFEKEINPEKQGSIFDMKFAKKWVDSCDEAERLSVYKSAYKSYEAVSKTCVFLWLFCVIGADIWNFGLIPITMVSIIWIVLISSYCLEAIRLSKNSSGERQ